MARPYVSLLTGDARPLPQSLLIIVVFYFLVKASCSNFSFSCSNRLGSGFKKPNWWRFSWPLLSTQRRNLTAAAFVLFLLIDTCKYSIGTFLTSPDSSFLITSSRLA